jgi:uncharacterized protein (DUF983 family)
MNSYFGELKCPNCKSKLLETTVKKEFKCSNCEKQLLADYYLANLMLMIIASIFLSIIFYLIEFGFALSLIVIVVIYTLLYCTIYKYLLNIRLKPIS